MCVLNYIAHQAMSYRTQTLLCRHVSYVNFWIQYDGQKKPDLLLGGPRKKPHGAVRLHVGGERVCAPERLQRWEISP